MSEQRIKAIVASLAEQAKQDKGRKIPCPYCTGSTGFNQQANAKCGFCKDGVHTIGT